MSRSPASCLLAVLLGGSASASVCVYICVGVGVGVGVGFGVCMLGEVAVGMTRMLQLLNMYAR